MGKAVFVCVMWIDSSSSDGVSGLKFWLLLLSEPVHLFVNIMPERRREENVETPEHLNQMTVTNRAQPART